MDTQSKISVAEIAKHATQEDCWVVVNDQVYDLTKFAPEHPGGPQMIYKWAGKDGSSTYNQFHSASLISDTLSASERKGPFDTSTITETWLNAQKQETASKPTDPNEKPPLSSLINLDDFERAFGQSGSRKAWAYIHGASNDLLTLNANRRAWQKLWFRPRVMRNVSAVNTRTSMFGVPVSMPVWICPMGIAKTAGPEGETALGAGAAAAGIVHCMSTTSSFSPVEILASAPKYPFFFQLYVNSDRSKTEALLRTLNEHSDQIRAIFVTADLPVVSKREADERLKADEDLNATQYVTNSSTPEKAKPISGGLARSTGSSIDPALNWEDLAWLRKHTRIPLVIKGIQSPTDALLAHTLGCAGIVLSNHGGRALDNAPSTLSTLLELRRDCPAHLFADPHFSIFIDGGVRRGSDVLKAIMLGARGVGVGRPMQCAVAYGREGVEAAAAILQDELNTAMRLCGITDLDGVRGSMEYLNTRELERELPPPPLPAPAAATMMGAEGVKAKL